MNLTNQDVLGGATPAASDRRIPFATLKLSTSTMQSSTTVPTTKGSAARPGESITSDSCRRLQIHLEAVKDFHNCVATKCPLHQRSHYSSQYFFHRLLICATIFVWTAIFILLLGAIFIIFVKKTTEATNSASGKAKNLTHNRTFIDSA